MTHPDPDGGGARTAPVVAFTYDSRGNMLTTGMSGHPLMPGGMFMPGFPVSGERAWTYDGTFATPLSYTDEMDFVTLFTLDEFGRVVEQRRVVGEEDDEINEETDDVVTTWGWITNG